MRCVLDSNVAVKWLLVEENSDKALRLRDEWRGGLHEFLAPDIFMVEAAHALTKAERQGRVTPAEVEVLILDLMATSPDFHPHAPLLSRAIELSLQARHGVYDCLYVALAEREGCELLTADDKMLGKFGPNSPSIVPLSSL